MLTVLVAGGIPLIVLLMVLFFATPAWRTFIVACLAIEIIAVGAYVTLDAIQKPADVAYSTSSVRI